jgi:5'(3')-deoxyribonucleotidase
MKILIVSIPSIHITRWIENLSHSSYELFWFDIREVGKLKTTSNIIQISDWKRRKLPNIKGEYYIKKSYPKIYSKVQGLLETTVPQKFESILEEVKPDIVHSFCMQVSCYPIVDIMNKNNIPWVYSCWGSDLYYFQQFENHKKIIKSILKRTDFLLADCDRDINLAKQLLFKNWSSEVIPGGGGYVLEEIKKFITPYSSRKIILIKGYEHHFGRALNVIKAIEKISTRVIEDYEIIVFGAHADVINYLNIKSYNWKVYGRNDLSHEDILKLMGKSRIYIGNSISDGLPNTLIEAYLMGAFMIQSNPGGASNQIIKNGENGYFINDPEDIREIKLLIEKSILETTDFEKMSNDFLHIDYNYAYESIQNKILRVYESVVQKHNNDNI